MASRNIAQIYDFIQYITRKQRGVFTSINDAMAALDSGQLDCLEYWYKQYGETGEIHDAIRPFRIYYPFTSSSAGFVTFPSDYLHLLGTPFTIAGSTVNQVKEVNEDELPFALTSQLRAVTNAYPIYVDTSTGFSIYPQQTQIGFFTYLRRPATPVYSYSQMGRAITYDPATSTQLEWSDIYINKVIAEALKYLGVNMSESEIFAFAENWANENK